MAVEPVRPAVLATDDLAVWDAVTTAERIAAGEVSAEAVLEAAIDRIDRLAPELGAMVTVAPDQAREVLARRLAAGDTDRPLHGVPTAVKDLDEQAGLPTTFGTKAAGGHVSRRTSPTVAQFLSTGVISLGKSAAPEYGMNPSRETPGFVPTRNPWDPGRTAGGSSSGAGALVASGILPLAYAADGGGSIRIPAAACGAVGLKPTYGRLVETADMRGLPVKLVTYGVITRTVRDTEAFLVAAQRHWADGSLPPLALDDRLRDPGRLRALVVTESPMGEVHADVVAATRRTATDLEAMGHHVEEKPIPFADTLGEDFLLYWGALAQGLMAAGFTQVGPRFRPSKLDDWTKGLAAHARVNAWRVPGAVRRLRRFRDEYALLMTRYDLVVTPTLGTPAPPLGWLEPGQDFAEHRRRVEEFVPFTPAWNVSGAPAISLPMAVGSAGVPIGVQLGAAHGADGLLLRVAAALEGASGFNVPL